MADQLTIANVALSRIGANQIISLSEGTTEQKLVVVLWDTARRSCLRDHPWNFATTDVELNQIADYVSFEFKYSFQIPSDCLRILKVYGNPNFKLQGRCILTDQPIVKLKYVKDIVDSSEWDATFDDVMAQRLAADMAFALSKTQGTADSMFAIYDKKLRNARHIDSTEEVLDMLGDGASGLIGARY